MDLASFIMLVKPYKRKILRKGIHGSAHSENDNIIFHVQKICLEFSILYEISINKVKSN